MKMHKWIVAIIMEEAFCGTNSRYWSNRENIKLAKTEFLAISTQSLRSSRRRPVTEGLGEGNRWLVGSIEGILLSQSHLGSLMARKMTAIARSATATEFIGTESVQGQASTDKRQSS